MEVAGLVVGIIALVVSLTALPTILQMIYGRPKLTFETDEFTGTVGKILVVAIKNQPVTNWFLRKLGVERESGDVLAHFDVFEQGTQKVMVRALTGLLECAPLGTQGKLARALPGYTVGLVIINTKDGQAAIIGGNENMIPIAAGHYLTQVMIVRGDKRYNLVQAFRVGNLDHETIWFNRGAVKTL